MSTAPLRLNAFAMACVGHQAAGLWARPEDRSAEYRTLRYWTDLARLLERGGFDALFLADVLGVYDVHGGSRDAAVRAAAQVPVNDPLMAVSAMAAVTEQLGFGLTVTTTYEQPYALARRLTTLDHLTGGRVAWNVVTGYLDSAARNLGFDRQVPHDERYDVAEEYLEVCYKLWEGSWEDSAVVRDAERGVYADPAKVHDIGHHGRWFDVPGAFLCEPSPQRTPVVFQAGSSPRGQEFAARHAECVFVIGPTAKHVRRTVDSLRERVERAGRDPRSVTVYAGLTAVVRPSDAEATALLADYRAHASRDGALALFGGWTGVDLAGLAPGEPLQHVTTDANRSALSSFTSDPDRTWTVDDLARFVAVGGRGPVLAGSPATVADALEEFAEVSGVDGFNLMYATMPGTFADVVDHLVPELARRGRTAPPVAPGTTLRERLGSGEGARLAASHPGAAHRRPVAGTTTRA
ncbi:LLM class flavin-dependent oxidoreductase [Paenibacillus sp. TRM 82003]|uniref:LLM class flavin-dependent oxidoreductase n=1 Tax=Kineococcus sp. TRM81007 TaxID=2925831 RepID=UPI001F58FEA7|nr:LLM class flavin-dependent oxidoreductase [Kineococcus sp. TRM81007]MCI2238840.1 LLM class flavin-dependent oxidoreductase [Kineococcus sp. TRM81007]MCI3924245.1 LLM class flavin-dependent oxidoreductase [Paenibacillus sp. TRM 82003]